MDARQKATSHEPGPRSMDRLDVPAMVLQLANGDVPELAWHNELHGLTFRLGDRYLKWNPRSTGIDLNRERVRLRWLQGRHVAPVILDYGEDEHAQWMLTAVLPARSVVQSDRSVRPEIAVPAIAQGLLALHALPADEFPVELFAASWANREPPQLGPKPAVDGRPVVVHGDACAPNTLIGADHTWAGHVDVGDMTVGDRWADLAVASMSLEWNYTPPLEELFWSTYGVRPDEERIHYYRALWDAES